MTFPRSDMAKRARITTAQLDYLIKLGIVAPDTGGPRKTFSLHEARLTVIAGALLPFFKKADFLVEPMRFLRNCAAWPEAERPTLAEMEQTFTEILEAIKKDEHPRWSSADCQAIYSARDFERACSGCDDLYLHVAADEDGWRASIQKRLSEPDDVFVWASLNVRRLFDQTPMNRTTI